VTTTKIPYTGKTVRLDTPTEPLSIPTPRPAQLDIAVLTLVALALILGGAWLVVRVNDHAFAVLAACLVAGFIYLAFGRQG
jgi:flagellar biogenesis protein FliO